MRLSVNLFSPLPEREPLPGGQLEIDSDRTEVEVTTEIPGGFGTCSIGIPELTKRQAVPGRLPEPLADIRDFPHIEVSAGTVMVYEGRVSEYDYDGWGRPTGISAEGYGAWGLNDSPILDPPVFSITSGDAIQRALVDGSAPVEPGHHWSDPGVSHDYDEFADMTPGEVIDQIIKAGGVDGNAWDFAVWENQRASLLPRTVPEIPDYRVQLDGVIIQSMRRSSKSLYGAVVLRYEKPDGTKADTGVIEDDTFENRYGFQRTRLLEGGILSDVAAARFARTWLELHRVPQWDISLSVPARRRGGLIRTMGGETALHLVRAGQWLEIPGLPQAQMIKSTSYNSISGSLGLSIGNGITSSADLFRHLRDSTNKQAREISPTTGAKRR